MIGVEYHRYQLTPKASLNSTTGDGKRNGALLKLTFPDGLVGYADLFPWPEWGDNSLDVELDRISQGKISKLAEQSFALARKDAELRSAKENLSTKYSRIRNHFLVTDVKKVTKIDVKNLIDQGFQTLKVKVGRDLEAEAAWLEAAATLQIKLRLDFNLQGNDGRFEKLVTSFSPVLKSKIEFIEDPFPFSQQAWRQAQSLAPLALDQEIESVHFDQLNPNDLPFNYVILKPARQDHRFILEQMSHLRFKLVVTSCLDHPVGIAHALRVASEIKRFHPNSVVDCGCLSHLVYQSTAFAAEIVTKGPFVAQINGTGIGFDGLFATTPWISLVKKK